MGDWATDEGEAGREGFDSHLVIWNVGLTQFPDQALFPFQTSSPCSTCATTRSRGSHGIVITTNANTQNVHGHLSFFRRFFLKGPHE